MSRICWTRLGYKWFCYQIPGCCRQGSDCRWVEALGVGEYIFVINSGYRYTYKVVSNAYVSPNDASVMRHEDKSFLTLITCDTYDEKTGTYLRRVVVRATLVDVRRIIR